MKFWIDEARDCLGERQPPVPSAQRIEPRDHDDWDEPVYTVEVETLADLLQLAKDVGCQIVVDSDWVDDAGTSQGPRITLYNDYLE